LPSRALELLSFLISSNIQSAEISQIDYESTSTDVNGAKPNQTTACAGNLIEVNVREAH
jgi:hypothetical protein